MADAALRGREHSLGLDVQAVLAWVNSIRDRQKTIP
jgi:hypothetical protein